MTSDILVSVVVPVFNHRAFVKQAIHGIQSQTHSNLEIIVGDDGSTDGSYDVLLDLSRSDSRIRLFRQENSGPGATLNHALSLCNGQLIATTASDDVFYKEKIECQINCILERPNVVGALSHVDFINENDQLIDAPEHLRPVFNVPNRPRAELLVDFLVRGNTLNASSGLYRKEVFDKIGGFRPSCLQLHDWEFYFRCLELGDLDVIQNRLMAYRVRSDQGNLSSATNNIRSENELFLVIPSLLESVAKHCPREMLMDVAKLGEPIEVQNTLSGAPLEFLIYFLCQRRKIGPFRIAGAQYFARWLDSAQAPPQLFKQFFEGMNRKDFNYNSRVPELRKLISQCQAELNLVKDQLTNATASLTKLQDEFMVTNRDLIKTQQSYNFQVGRIILYLPKLLIRLLVRAVCYLKAQKN